MILLAAADWRLRAPLRAQLIEEGYEVMAVSSWDEAEILLLKRAVRPGVTIVDLEGEIHPTAILPTLARLVDPSKVVVLTSASGPSVEDVKAAGFVHVLARPFTVGEVVKELQEVEGRR